MREASLTYRQKTEEGLYGSYATRVGTREVTAQSKATSRSCADVIGRGGGKAMRKLTILLLCTPLFLAGVALHAAAEPKGPNGEKCDSSATGVTHQIQGKDYTCDKCVYLKCDTSGGQISNCTKTTYWSNCVAALSRPPGVTLPGGIGVLQQVPLQQVPPSTTVPPSRGTPPGGILQK